MSHNDKIFIAALMLPVIFWATVVFILIIKKPPGANSTGGDKKRHEAPLFSKNKNTKK